MTQPENKPEPKDGDFVWIIALNQTTILRWKDGFENGPFRFIARVLTPDEVAAKDAEIERLKQYLDASTKQFHEQRETIAELVEALIQAHHHMTALHSYRVTDLTQEIFDAHLNNGVPRDQLEFMSDFSVAIATCEAALTKAKELGK